MESGVNKVGEYFYNGRNIPVYCDSTQEKSIMSSWSATNPDAFYTGMCYVNHKTGKTTYPEGAVIKTPTDEDRHMICKFIIIPGNDVESMKDKIQEALEIGDKKYNKKC